ncbi:response regulator [Fundidesulfovibrio terrae]|uniref:response regulator n=1 Tax=Fundidesulfovibrio terrae TaxID=2922866 RepID=UPI001FAFF27E|nr:response regulator [Fundidesulfovibrio terrae]
MNSVDEIAINAGDILVVDDNPNNVELLDTILVSAGYRVRSSRDGEHALRSAKENPPGLILLDILMPGMNGFEVCRRLKDDEATRDIPVIILSALMDTADKIRGFELGAVDYLTKPVQKQEALARIKTHLALAGATKRLHAQNLQLGREVAERTQAQEELSRHKEHLEELVAARTLELTKANEKYLAIFMEARDGIILTDPKTGFILDSNPEFLRQCGRDAQVLKYMRIWELLPEEQSAVGRNAYEAIVRQGEGAQEVELRRPDGTVLFAEYAAKVITFSDRRVVQFVSRDVTEGKRLKEELAKSHHYIKNIFDSMPSQIIGVDPQGKLTHWNLAVSAAAGGSVELAEGKPLEEALPRFADYLENIKLAIRERRPVSIERQPCWDDGELCFQNIMFYPLVADSIDGVVIRVDDVTEHVRISDILIQSEKMASVGGLAAGMAHEINNPLGSILQSAQVLLKRFAVDHPANIETARECNSTMENVRCYFEKRQGEEFLVSIREAGAKASKIVRSMLDFSRKSDTNRALANVNDILERSLELASTDYDLKKKYDFRQISIIKEFADNLPSVPCIQSEIEQVMLNLLKNAAQALADQPPGDRKPAITLFTSRVDGFVRIVVEDNGPGIEEKIRRRIFDPFFTTKKVGEGTGLGLSVSYYIIANNHGGKISVESEPGAWTRFIIDLPVQAQA